MSQAQKLTPEEQKLALLEKKKAQEQLHSIVVKVISWRAGLQEGATVKADNKITPKEWSAYKEHLFNTYKDSGKSIALTKLQEAETLIRAHGGFQ